MISEGDLFMISALIYISQCKLYVDDDVNNNNEWAKLCFDGLVLNLMCESVSVCTCFI